MQAVRQQALAEHAALQQHVLLLAFCHRSCSTCLLPPICCCLSCCCCCCKHSKPTTTLSTRPTSAHTHRHVRLGRVAGKPLVLVLIAQRLLFDGLAECGQLQNAGRGELAVLGSVLQASHSGAAAAAGALLPLTHLGGKAAAGMGLRCSKQIQGQRVRASAASQGACACHNVASPCGCRPAVRRGSPAPARSTPAAMISDCWPMRLLPRNLPRMRAAAGPRPAGERLHVEAPWRRSLADAGTTMRVAVRAAAAYWRRRQPSSRSSLR